MKKEKKIDVTDLEQPSEIVETMPEALVKKPRKAVGEKKVEKPEVVAKTPPKKQAKKPAKPKAKKAPGRKPGRKPAAKKPGLIGRKTDLIKMGEGAFLYSLELTRRVEDLERENAGYRRMFEAIRELFSREMDEIEESQPESTAWAIRSQALSEFTFLDSSHPILFTGVCSTTPARHPHSPRFPRNDAESRPHLCHTSGGF